MFFFDSRDLKSVSKILKQTLGTLFLLTLKFQCRVSLFVTDNASNSKVSVSSDVTPVSSVSNLAMALPFSPPTTSATRLPPSGSLSMPSTTESVQSADAQIAYDISAAGSSIGYEPFSTTPLPSEILNGYQPCKDITFTSLVQSAAATNVVSSSYMNTPMPPVAISSPSDITTLAPMFGQLNNQMFNQMVFDQQRLLGHTGQALSSRNDDIEFDATCPSISNSTPTTSHNESQQTRPIIEKEDILGLLYENGDKRSVGMFIGDIMKHFFTEQEQASCRLDTAKRRPLCPARMGQIRALLKEYYPNKYMSYFALGKPTSVYKKMVNDRCRHLEARLKKNVK